MAHLYGLARLGRDAEVRYTPSGDAVANLSLAFTYGRKGNDGKRPTQWVDGSLWGKLAEAIAPYLLKGGLVAVTLEDVHLETFTKSDGTSSTKLTGKVSAIELAGGNPANAPTEPVRQAAASPARRSNRMEETDQDIPF